MYLSYAQSDSHDADYEFHFRYNYFGIRNQKSKQHLHTTQMKYRDDIQKGQ